MVHFVLILDLSVSLFFVVVHLLFSSDCWDFFSLSTLSFLLFVWNYLLYSDKTTD